MTTHEIPALDVATIRRYDQILDVAERLAQVRGFNGFSYADIAAELGITKAALHYHFATKSELGRALVVRYTSRFGGALARAGESDVDAVGMLRSFCGLYTEVLRNGRMCLCGMLAAEYHTLPNDVQGAVMAFFNGNERWLSEVLATGRDDGSISFEGTPTEMARFVVGELEGAMLLARLHDDVERFQVAVDRLVGGLADRRAGASGGRRGHR